MYLPSAPHKYIQRRNLFALRGLSMIIAVVGAVRGRQQPQIAPAALGSVLDDSRDRRLRDHRQVHAILYVRALAIQPVENRRACRAGRRHLWSEHEAVNNERIFSVIEELRQANWCGTGRSAARLLKDVVVRRLATERQLTPLGGDGFKAPAQVHLCLEERIARGAIAFGLSWESN